VFLWLETLETPRIAGTIEWIIKSKKCSSTSIQLVQLPTPSNIPGVSMVRNTGDSEDNTGQWIQIKDISSRWEINRDAEHPTYHGDIEHTLEMQSRLQITEI